MAHPHRWIEMAGEGAWTGFGCQCGRVKEVDLPDGSTEIRLSVDPARVREQIRRVQAAPPGARRMLTQACFYGEGR